ncbi:hypothetical protein LTR37_014161 [Vermiconidia calcicola]|uniref:Uncharacterized protein n=1 Tax=Vermiconidia calcicola TaxID=1690605 RepID=A0ACC3MUD4_9PEZI|nr:hypothetical protein LTR37_014161 [Vermiconidia calcicola]
MHTFQLNTGSKIPAVALGTWQSQPGRVKSAVAHALNVGYRHVDCAFVYGNENEVGQGLAEAFKAGIKREDVFVTSKLWNTFHRDPEKCLDETLRRLGLDYVDLYLIHWPVPMNPNGNDPLFPKHPDGSRDLDTDIAHWETWTNMEKLLTTGKTSAVGVSNYSVKYLEELLSHCDVVPAVNQIENHPYLPQKDIHDFCKAKGILVEAYSPLGSTDSPLFEEPAVKALANQYHVGAGTILISYQVSRGHVALPKSVTPGRIEENLRLIQLGDDDLKALDSIHESRGTKRFVYPPFGVDLGFADKQ